MQQLARIQLTRCVTRSVCDRIALVTKGIAGGHPKIAHSPTYYIVLRRACIFALHARDVA